MKRNKFLRIATVLMALVLVSSLGMVGTLARYVTALEGITSTVVRAGAFDVSIDIDELDWEYEEEDHIKITDGDFIIVPGAVITISGAINIVNDSEVCIQVGVDPDAAAPFTFGDFLDAIVEIYDTDEEEWVPISEADLTLAHILSGDIDDGVIYIEYDDSADLEIEIKLRWTSDAAELGDAYDDYEDTLVVWDGTAPKDSLPDIRLSFALFAAQVLPGAADPAHA